MTGKTLWMAVAIAALVGASAVAGETVAAKANIPFDFMVGNQLVPAGEYLITQDAARNSVRILSTGGGVSLAIFRHPAAENKTGLPYALVFRKYGERHFLRQIWTGASTDGVEMPLSRTEKEQMVRYAPDKTTLVAAAAAR